MEHMVRRLLGLTMVAGLAFGAFGGTTVYVDCASQATAEPYAAPVSAAKTIKAAMTYVGTLGDEAYPVEIVIAKGTYTENNFALDKAITVRGATGNPADVVIDDKTAGKRAFTIGHADAVVSNLTIKGSGYNTSGNNPSTGGHVYMTDGLIENCVIRDGYAYAGQTGGGYSKGQGGNVYMTGGRLVRCQVLNGHNSNSGAGSAGQSGEYGAGVYAGGTAVVDTCLVKGCTVGKYGFGSVYADGSAQVVNCTIVGNTMGANAKGAGIYVKSSTAKVVNTVMFNNGGTDVAEFGGANPGRFFHCASAVANASCATWMTVTANDFIDVPTGDYHPQPNSAMVDGGSTDSEWYPEGATTIDIEGLSRKSGSAIDVGCYELDQSKIIVGGGLSAYGALEGARIRFTASAKGGAGGAYTYRWDFGNGVTNETTDAEILYGYPGSGLFTVRVSAKDDGGEWTDWVVLGQNVAVMPELTYVDANSANPAFPYRTRETAAKKISTVLQAMTNNVSAGKPAIDGMTIRVCKGTVTDSGCTLSRAITICGDTGNPADVIIDDKTAGKRAFAITHTNAVVRDLTIKGRGYYTTSNSPSTGGHVYMTAGCVENCVVRDGYAFAGQIGGGYSKGQGGNVYMTGGRLVRCQILNGRNSEGQGTSASWTSDYGAGVYAGGTAVVDTCLVKGCTVGKYGFGSVYADGSAQVVNCTIVGNTMGANAKGAGIYVKSSTAKVVNTVMFNNGGTDVAEFGGANLDCFVRCASSTNNEKCVTWQVVDETAFKDWASRETDLRALVPAAGKPLVGTGTDAAGYKAAGGTATLDLLGKPRRKGRRIDIGCFESQSGGSALILR